MNIIDNFNFEIHKNEIETISKIRKYPNSFYFSSNHYQSYFPINIEYGPINIKSIIEFVYYIESKMNNIKFLNKSIVYYIYDNDNSSYLLNTILLLCSFLLYYTNYSIDYIIHIFQNYLTQCPDGFIDCNNVYNSSFKSCLLCIHSLQSSFDNISIKLSISFDLFDLENIHIIIISNYIPQKIKNIVNSKNINNVIFSKNIYDKIFEDNICKHNIQSIDNEFIIKFTNMIQKSENNILLLLNLYLDDLIILICIYFVLKFDITIDDSITCIRLFTSYSLSSKQITKLKSIKMM